MLNNKKGQIFWIALVAIVVIGGVVLFSGGSDTPSYETDTTDAETAGESDDSFASDDVDLDEGIEESGQDTDTSGTYCTPGQTYAYSGEGGSVDAQIIGVESYRGKQFCKATATSVVESPAGDITNDVVYYFNADATELYIVTTTSSDALPQPQTNEVHLVDGQVVA